MPNTGLESATQESEDECTVVRQQASTEVTWCQWKHGVNAAYFVWGQFYNQGSCIRWCLLADHMTDDEVTERDSSVEAWQFVSYWKGLKE